MVLARPCLRALALFRGQRAVAPRPSLKGRKTGCPDRFPVTRFMLFEQAVAHQKPKAALADVDRRDHGHTP